MSDIAIKDKDDSRSLVNMVSNGAMRDAILACPDDLFEMTEEDLHAKCKPSSTDEMIRMSFWNEYDLAHTRSRKMDITNVYVRSCTKDYFFKKFITSSFKVAWLLTPPKNYTIMLDVLLNKGLSKLDEIISQPLIQPIIDKRGEVHYQTDSKLAAVVAKITSDINDRKHGAATQMVKSVSVHHQVNHTQNTEEIKDISDVDKKIKELESKLKIPSSIEAAEYKEVK